MQYATSIQTRNFSEFRLHRNRRTSIMKPDSKCVWQLPLICIKSLNQTKFCAERNCFFKAAIKVQIRPMVQVGIIPSSPERLGWTAFKLSAGFWSSRMPQLKWWLTLWWIFAHGKCFGRSTYLHRSSNLLKSKPQTTNMSDCLSFFLQSQECSNLCNDICITFYVLHIGII